MEHQDTKLTSMCPQLKELNDNPYVGIGLGRAVPKGRLGFQFDAGVQFWGTPKVYIDGANGKEQLTEEDTNGDDGGAIKTLSKITVYPCISFRLVGRIL